MVFAPILVVLVGLLLLRLVGERYFRVLPELMPPITVDQSTPLYESTQRLLTRSESPATTLYYPLGDPQLALLSRFELIDQATRSIDAQYYLFHDDQAGRALLANLIAAARRGVKVRLLLDDMDTHGRDGLFTRLCSETENFEIRIFNPSYLRKMRFIEYIARFPRVTRRMHNKSLSVDSIASIVGGRNIGNEYFDVASKIVFTDFDVLAAGGVVSDIVVEFDRYWYSGISVEASRLGKAAPDKKYNPWMDSLKDAQNEFRTKLSGENEIASRQLVTNELQAYYSNGTVVFDQPEKVLSKLTDTSNSLAPRIVELLSSAKEDLLISSPYFIPGDVGLKLFGDLRQRGVRITILTNSFAANDVTVVHAGYIDYRKQLVEMGVNLFEFKAEHVERNWSMFGSSRSSLHAKTFVIDQRRNFVGSFNLDPRSAIHNTEMGLIFDNHAFGMRAFDRLKDSLGQNAYKVQLSARGRLEWVETDENGNNTILTTEPGTTWWQRTATYLMSWLPVEWLM